MKTISKTLRRVRGRVLRAVSSGTLKPKAQRADMSVYVPFLKKTDLRDENGYLKIHWKPARAGDLRRIWNGPKIVVDKQRRGSARQLAPTITERHASG